MKRLDKIEARARAATPGPWTTDGAGEVNQHWSRPEPWETVVGTDVVCMSYCYGGTAARQPCTARKPPASAPY